MNSEKNKQQNKNGKKNKNAQSSHTSFGNHSSDFLISSASGQRNSGFTGNVGFDSGNSQKSFPGKTSSVHFFDFCKRILNNKTVKDTHFKKHHQTFLTVLKSIQLF